MSRAVVQEGFVEDDPLSTLKFVEKPIPKAAPGQVVVNVTLRPLNPTDLNSIRNGDICKEYGQGSPGSEGYGIVHELGEGVTKVKKGQRVVPVTGLEVFKGNGSWQEYIAIKEEFVWAVPDWMSDETAAQFVINPWTSLLMLKELDIPAGEYVLLSAAGSVLGKQLIKLAKHWGIKSIAIVRRAEQRAELEALGADAVIVSSEEDIVTRVKEVTAGKGGYAALDAVGNTMTPILAESLRDGGHMFRYGGLGGKSVVADGVDLGRGVGARRWVIYVEVMPHAELRNAVAAEAADLIKQGVFQVSEDCDIIPLAEFKTGIAQIEKGGRGSRKILLTST